MVQQQPVSGVFDSKLLEAFENVKEAVSGVRNIRKAKNVAGREKPELKIQPGDRGYEPDLNPILQKLAALSAIEIVDEEVTGAASFMVRSTNFYLLLDGTIDATEELAKLEDELKYTFGFLSSVMKKLNNERFIQGAPADVVAREKSKQADAEARIKVIEERINSLKSQ